MAQAKKCDRCGKLYEHYPINKQAAKYKWSNGIKLVKMDSSGYISAESDPRDLCPECMDQIIKLLLPVQND